jgi:hypothetical protein
VKVDGAKTEGSDTVVSISCWIETNMY